MKPPVVSALGAAMEARLLVAEAIEQNRALGRRRVGATGLELYLREALRQVDVAVDLLDEMDKESAYGQQRDVARGA